jgi:hypothetical protein
MAGKLGPHCAEGRGLALIRGSGLSLSRRVAYGRHRSPVRSGPAGCLPGAMTSERITERIRMIRTLGHVREYLAEATNQMCAAGPAS